MLLRRFLTIAVLIPLAAVKPTSLAAQGDDSGVTYEDILEGLSDPSSWLTYSGDYTGRRVSKTPGLSCWHWF